MKTLSALSLAFPVMVSAQAVTMQVSPNLRMVPGLHNEPWVAISPTNPDVMIAAAQQGDGTPPYRFGVTTVLSRDGGRTWSTVNLPDAPPTPFDVMTYVGADGRLYVMSGVVGGAFAAQVTQGGAAKSLIRFWSSGDNGFTWDRPVDLASSVDPDHMRMTIDMSPTKTRGRIYVLWNDVADLFVQDQYEIFLQWSDDHGKTFNQPKLIATGHDGKLVATEPVVLSDGTLLATWYQYFNPLARRDNEKMPMYVARSTDGGKTFAPTQKIFEFGPHIWRERVTEFSRAFSLPIVMADTSSTSPNRDNIYITWDDVSGGASNIWFVRSTDKGRTWSKPLKINDNPPAPSTGIRDYRMTPVVAVNPAGVILLAWYDRRNDPNRMCWDYYGAVSRDAGQSFSSNAKLTTAASCPPPSLAPSAWVHNVSPRLPDPNRMPDSLLERRGTIERLQTLIGLENQAARDEANAGLTSSRLTLSFDPARNQWPGHYTGLAASRNGSFHGVWLDRRNGVQELYSARITIDAPSRPSDLTEQDVSKQMELVAGAPTFDNTKRTVTVPLQIRNVGTATVYGPISVRLQGVGGVAGSDTTITFTGKLGTGDRLLQKDLSEPLSVTFTVKPDAGWDASFDFRVTAMLSRGR